MAMGRPRAFDADEALGHALQVFWRSGYEGATMTDLTRAMGINPPSLYAAFGSKEGLFREALDRYVAARFESFDEAARAPTAQAFVERLLRGTAAFLSARGHPRGCLLVQGALACGAPAESVRRALVARRQAGQALIRRRFERARAEGDLPSDVDPGDLARYVATVMEGMAVQAAAGAGRAELTRVADTTMRGFSALRRQVSSRMKKGSKKR